MGNSYAHFGNRTYDMVCVQVIFVEVNGVILENDGEFS